MSILNGIGKKRGFIILKKYKDDFFGLNNLGIDCIVISDEILIVCFKFIGFLYGEVILNLNYFRYKFFIKKYLESSKFLLIEDSVLFYVKRVNY